MAITNYGELKSSIALWLVRTDLTTQIPNFIALAESDIRRDVRVQAMESLVSGTLTGETLAHPTRYTEARRLTVGGYVYTYKLPVDYAEAVRNDSTDYIYTSIGQSLYILNGASGDDYTLIYSSNFDAMTADADTNWLLTNAPDVYLFGALRYGSMYMLDDQAMARHTATYLNAVKRLNGHEHVAKYSGSPLTIRPG